MKLATDREAMLDELGLSGSPVYVPADTPRVYVPEPILWMLLISHSQRLMSSHICL